MENKDFNSGLAVLKGVVKLLSATEEKEKTFTDIYHLIDSLYKKIADAPSNLDDVLSKIQNVNANLIECYRRLEERINGIEEDLDIENKNSVRTFEHLDANVTKIRDSMIDIGVGVQVGGTFIAKGNTQLETLINKVEALEAKVSILNHDMNVNHVQNSLGLRPTFSEVFNYHGIADSMLSENEEPVEPVSQLIISEPIPSNLNTGLNLSVEKPTEDLSTKIKHPRKKLGLKFPTDADSYINLINETLKEKNQSQRQLGITANVPNSWLNITLRGVGAKKPDLDRLKGLYEIAKRLPQR